jgi:spermidine synthase
MHWLIPTAGLQLALITAALVDMSVGLFLLRSRAQDRGDFWKLGTATAVVILCTWISSAYIQFDPRMLASGVFRYGFAGLNSEIRVIYYRDGKTASVSVAEDNSNTLAIATNGKIDAAIVMADNLPPSSDENTMVLAASLPIGFHANPELVGVIGFGSGLTTHTFLGDARIKQVDTIEIEPAMIDGARAFGPRVERAFTDSRSNIIIDDAKSYFSSQKSKYDIIISEPSNPWISGVGGLFSREFYNFVPNHLKENGLFVQWLQLYEIDDQLVASVINGLTPAFSDYSAWLVNSSDLIIVATPRGKLPEFDVDRILKGTLATELARLGISDAGHINLRCVATGPLLRGYGELYKTRANSYYYPLLSLEAPRTRFTKANAKIFPLLANSSDLMLEALDVRKPLKAGVSPSLLGHIVVESATRLARANGEFLRGQPVITPVNDLEDPLKPAMLLTDVVRQICRDPSKELFQEMFVKQMKAVANITLAPLGEDLQYGVWINPRWMPCDPAVVSPDAKRAFAFMQAQARRDWSAARRLGEDWIQNPPGKYWHQLDELALSAVLIDLAREKKWAELVDAEKKLGASISSAGSHLAARMLLLGIAKMEQNAKQP